MCPQSCNEEMYISEICKPAGGCSQQITLKSLAISHINTGRDCLQITAAGLCLQTSKRKHETGNLKQCCVVKLGLFCL